MRNPASGILGPLAAYNESQTSKNDYRPLIIAIDDAQGRVVGGLWARTSTTGCAWICCSCRTHCAGVGWALS